MNLLLLLFGALQSAIIAPSLAPPPIITTPVLSANPASEPFVGRFVAGPVTCNGAVVEPLHRVKPLPVGYTPFRPVALPPVKPTPAVLLFDLDSSGRPTNIRNARPSIAYPVNALDVAPAFSLWRFAPGAPRQNCQISFDLRAGPVARAELPLLYEYLALQRPNLPGFNSSVVRAALDRARPAGSTCRGATSAPLEQHHPAFDAIAQAPGTASHSFLAYDVAADGRTRNVRLLHSGGNAELDRQSVSALRKWRFPAGARSGCIYSYFRRQTVPVPAPAPRPMTEFGADNPRCQSEPRWTSPLNPSYPEPYNRRSIEGWAVVAYDVAPWGAVGNVRVLASEPGEQFGERAAAAIRRATKPASTNGLSGCVQRVIFRIPPVGPAPAIRTD